jgi:hypothetical protein
MANGNFIEWAGTIFVALLLSCLISSVPFLIAGFIGSLPNRHGVISKKYDLVALRERDGIEGKFYFLGTGMIKSTEYYFWYRKDESGAISGGKTERWEGIKIFEEDSPPQMIEFETEYLIKYLENWLWIIGIDFRSDVDWCPRFTIPKGSIKEGYSL